MFQFFATSAVLLGTLAGGVTAQTAEKAVFVRWGSLSCPAGTSMLYQGIAAGSRYNHNGGGANSLCLHPNPQTPAGASSGNQDGGLLYGTEYQNDGVNDKNHDKDAACVVCQVDTPGDVYTQWGRGHSCSNGHKTLYSGYVMSETHTHQRSDFVCVDPAHDFHPRSTTYNHNGHLWYGVEVEGGAMDESIYPSNQDVGCSVCLAPREPYVRWGAKGCTKGSTMLYTGIPAAAYYSHPGSGANTLCLHSSPEFQLGTNRGSQNRARIYGIEYENSGVFDKNANLDAACAVCMPDAPGKVYVQWGRSKTCSNSHVALYSGFVMASKYNQKKSEFVCVDAARETHAKSSKSSHNGGLWYVSEVEGGSMDEAMYKSNIELGCTVCQAKKSVYVTWGQRACTKGSGKTLYSGVAAGGRVDHTGSGANTLCLHPKPETPAGAKSSSQTNVARIYGTEYRNTGAIDKNNYGDAACVVCELESPGNVYTQWGRSKSCSNGHQTLYSGFVMSSRYTQRKSEYVCVSALRELHAKNSKSGLNGGNAWYTVETESGAMDEDAYKHNLEVGCSVCRSDAVPAPPTMAPTVVFGQQPAFVKLMERVAKLESGLTAVDGKIATAVADQSKDLKAVNKSIQTDLSELKETMEKKMDAMSIAVKTAFANVAKLGLPAVESSVDYQTLCNGEKDPIDCVNLNCSEIATGKKCPATCETCEFEDRTPAVTIKDNKVKFSLNDGDSLMLDNGFEDYIMSATQVQDLVHQTVQAAFSSAADEL